MDRKVRLVLLAVLAALPMLAQCTYQVVAPGTNVSAAASTGTITINSANGCKWTTVSNDSWLTIVFGQSGTGNGNAGWAADRNTTPQGRTGTITVAGQTVTVTQAAQNCTFTTVGNLPSTFDVSGGKGLIQFKTNCSWQATTSATWITLASPTSGSADDTVNFTVAANPCVAARNASLTIGTQSFTISQSGSPANLTLSPTTIAVPVGGATGSVAVTTGGGCPWSATSSASWLTTTGATASLGSGTFAYAAAANTCVDPRTATFNVGSAQSVVTQAGSDANLSISPASASVPYTGGTGSVVVTTGLTCTWNLTADSSWITATPFFTGLGGRTNTFTYTVAANTGAARTGNVIIGTKRFTIQQDAAPAPAFSISAVVNAASYEAPPVSPGEIVTIYGAGFGPATIVTTQLTADQLSVTRSLAGIRVLFDGVPAPMIYSLVNQISAVVPYGVAGQKTTDVQVEWQGALTPKFTVPVRDSTPAIFVLNAATGQGAVRNQDTSVNDRTNPAARGSVISIYSNGGGILNPPAIDGELTPALKYLSLPVSVTIGGADAKIWFAGAAYGAVAGLNQINAEVPAGITPGDAVPVLIKAGDFTSSAGVTIAVK